METVHLSLGENCLTQAILTRHGFETPKTPYSDTRSNIDYALQLERDGYARLLDPASLIPGRLGAHWVPRNTALRCDPIFEEAHSKGFEFTHHDVLRNATHRESIQRKIDRLESLRGHADVRFLYHYRLHPDMDVLAVMRKAQELTAFYAVGGRRCGVVIVTQQLVPTEADRGIVEVIEGDVRVYVLETLAAWRGEDQDLFWARHDDDLLARMFTLAGWR